MADSRSGAGKDEDQSGTYCLTHTHKKKDA